MTTALRIRTAAIAAFVAVSATLAAATPAEAAPRLARADVNRSVVVDHKAAPSTQGFGWLGEGTEGFGWLGEGTEGFGWLGEGTEGFGWLGEGTEGFGWLGEGTEGAGQH